MTGGKGIHICAPVAPDLEWPHVRTFAKALAFALVEAHLEVFTAHLAIARRKGRIFVDYLRNGRGATAICPYSTRARAGAPVALPLSWSELARCPAANAFSMRDLMSRPRRAAPWKIAVRPSLRAAAMTMR